MPKLTKIDDYTLQFDFAVPFLLHTCTSHQTGVQGAFYLPKHYLKQFHIKYTPKESERLAKENGYDSWWQFFNAKQVSTAISGFG